MKKSLLVLICLLFLAIVFAEDWSYYSVYGTRPANPEGTGWISTPLYNSTIEMYNVSRGEAYIWAAQHNSTIYEWTQQVIWTRFNRTTGLPLGDSNV